MIRAGRHFRAHPVWPRRTPSGAVLLEVLSSFVITSTNSGPLWGTLVAIPSFALMVLISALEILVAGIQAYVFALLTSLYLNDAENLH